MKAAPLESRRGRSPRLGLEGQGPRRRKATSTQGSALPRLHAAPYRGTVSFLSLVVSIISPRPAKAGLFLGHASYAGIAQSSVGNRTDAKQRTVQAAHGLGDRLARQTLAASGSPPGGRGSVSRHLPLARHSPHAEQIGFQIRHGT
jgi:hypothetical protein